MKEDSWKEGGGAMKTEGGGGGQHIMGGKKSKIEAKNSNDKESLKKATI